MHEQFTLPGFETALQPTDRLFFAIIPTKEAAARILYEGEHLRGEYGLKGKLFAAGRLHVTLRYLGDYVGLSPAVVEAAMAAATSVNMAPFDVTFDRVASFQGRPRNRPFVMLAEQNSEKNALLKVFQASLSGALDIALEKVGIRIAHPHYTPHVTLLYDNRFVSSRSIEPVSWTVREFILVHSLLGRTRHVPLARWALLP